MTDLAQHSTNKRGSARVGRTEGRNNREERRGREETKNQAHSYFRIKSKKLKNRNRLSR